MIYSYGGDEASTTIMAKVSITSVGKLGSTGADRREKTS